MGEKQHNELVANRERLRSRQKTLREEKSRAVQLKFPTQIYAETVRRVDSENRDKANNPGVISTGADEQAEAARKADAIKRTVANEPLDDEGSLDDKIAKIEREFAANEAAIEYLDREIEKERTALAIQYCKQKIPEHNQLMRSLGKTALDFYAAWLAANELRQKLIDEGVGLRGVFQTWPHWLGHPLDRHSDFGDWLRAMNREGFVSSLPKEIRL